MALDLNSLTQSGGSGGAASMASGIAGATPYGAMANAAKGVADAVFGGGASSTAGDTGAITNDVNFGGIMIGDSAIRSPAAFATAQTSRRLASGQTAAMLPSIPNGTAVRGADGITYTSSVSASPGSLAAFAVGGIALLLILSRKK